MPMIEAKSPPETIRRVYDLWSTFCGVVAGPFEHKPKMIGLERAEIEPHDQVLEVAVGPGLTLVEILKQVVPVIPALRRHRLGYALDKLRKNCLWAASRI